MVGFLQCIIKKRYTLLKNILFDLGNVIIDIDFDRTIQAFRTMGVPDFFVDLDQTDPIFYNLEVGKINPNHFITYWQERCGSSDCNEIINAWNALLIGIKADVFPLLLELKEHYNLFIYSNTNAIHIDWVMRYLERHHEMKNWVPGVFKAAYYSHQLGYRKPEPEGFLKILNEQRIKASETLFIDDHIPNIHAALALGFQAIHKPAEMSLSVAISDNNLLIK